MIQQLAAWLHCMSCRPGFTFWLETCFSKCWHHRILIWLRQVAQGDEDHDTGDKGAHLGNCRLPGTTSRSSHDGTTCWNFGWHLAPWIFLIQDSFPTWKYTTQKMTWNSWRLNQNGQKQQLLHQQATKTAWTSFTPSKPWMLLPFITRNVTAATQTSKAVITATTPQCFHSQTSVFRCK